MTCPGQLLESIEFFAGRGQLNIDGLGEKLVCQLVEVGLIKNVADIFVLDAASLKGLERFGSVSANNLADAIAEARSSATFSRLLAALGVRHVGSTAAKSIAQKYTNMTALLELADLPDEGETFVESLCTVDGIGDIIARSLYVFLRNQTNREVIDALIERGLNPIEVVAEAMEGGLSGKVFVITGTLSAPRDDFKRRIEARGGKVTGSVSKSTDYLVAGAKTGKTKLAAAEKNEVVILDEEALEALLLDSSV
jgi:DNA ligase (NAD+)